MCGKDIRFRVIEVVECDTCLYRIQEKYTFLWWSWWKSMTFINGTFQEYNNLPDAEGYCQALQVNYRKEKDRAVVVFYANEF